MRIIPAENQCLVLSYWHFKASRLFSVTFILDLHELLKASSRFSAAVMFQLLGMSSWTSGVLMKRSQIRLWCWGQKTWTTIVWCLEQQKNAVPSGLLAEAGTTARQLLNSRFRVAAQCWETEKSATFMGNREKHPGRSRDVERLFWGQEMVVLDGCGQFCSCSFWSVDASELWDLVVFLTQLMKTSGFVDWSFSCFWTFSLETADEDHVIIRVQMEPDVPPGF